MGPIEIIISIFGIHTFTKITEIPDISINLGKNNIAVRNLLEIQQRQEHNLFVSITIFII